MLQRIVTPDGGVPRMSTHRATIKLGKYELVRSLAVGGMAEVFLARASGIEGFEKLVVVKRILPRLAESEEFVKMFLDEARLAAQLHHPNVAQVYDIGIDAGAHFFVMEYVEGHDLREVLNAAHSTGGLPIEHALTVVTGVAAGLHHAHEKSAPDGRSLGIVHRDVSPTNVLVSFDGAVKLVDFGVAKARSRQSTTRDGALKGKLSYMSPEQCRAETLDRRSDVFSLGLLLYELTTGVRPYGEELEYKLINLVAAGVVALPSSRVRGYPPGLEAIVMKALCPDTTNRYATAEELQLAIERYAAASHIQLSTVGLRHYMRALFPSARMVTSGSGELELPRVVTMEVDGPDGPSYASAPSVPAPRRPSRRTFMIVVGLTLAVAAVLTVLALMPPDPPAPWDDHAPYRPPAAAADRPWRSPRRNGNRPVSSS